VDVAGGVEFDVAVEGDVHECDHVGFLGGGEGVGCLADGFEEEHAGDVVDGVVEEDGVVGVDA
jgi:hypothetical protein